MERTSSKLEDIFNIQVPSVSGASADVSDGPHHSTLNGTFIVEDEFNSNNFSGSQYPLTSADDFNDIQFIRSYSIDRDLSGSADSTEPNRSRGVSTFSFFFFIININFNIKLERT